MTRPREFTPQIEDYSPRRAHARLRLGIPATFETIEGRQKVRLIDLSQGGAHLYIPNAGKVREGFLSWLRFEVFAVAVWQQADEVGLEFDTLLTYDELLEVRGAAPAIVQEEAMGAALAAREFVAGERHLGVDS